MSRSVAAGTATRSRCPGLVGQASWRWSRTFAAIRIRAVYTLRYAGAVYVLHVFQKKSKTGRETPQRAIEMVRRRLREAEQIAREKES